MSLTGERNRRAIAERPHQPAHVACPRSSRPVLPPGGGADKDIFQSANEASVGGGLPPCHAVGEKGGVAVGGHDPGVECLLIWSCTELPLPAKDEAIRTILPRHTAFLYRLEEHIFYSILPTLHEVQTMISSHETLPPDQIITASMHLRVRRCARSSNQPPSGRYTG